MAFFNQKEDVLDIKLTQYGKIMLQKGRFRPYYYCFYDDQVLYDSKYELLEDEAPTSYVNESQREIASRIKETPRMRTQHIYYGAESSVNERNQEYEFGRSYYDPKYGETRIKTIDSYYEDFDLAPNPAEKNRTLGYKVYNGPTSLRNSPVIFIKTTGEKFNNKVSFLTQSVSGLPIPQLYSTPKARITQDSAPELELTEEVARMLNKQNLFSTRIRLLDREINIEPPNLYLEFSEENSFYAEENYDLEVFYVRKRETVAGRRAYVLLHIPEVGGSLTMPTDGQYMIFTGSNGVTKAGFIVRDAAGMPGEHDQTTAYFDGNDRMVPMYVVRSADNVREFAENFRESLSNLNQDGLRDNYINEFITVTWVRHGPANKIYIAARTTGVNGHTDIISTMNGTLSRFMDVSDPNDAFSGGVDPVYEDYLVPLNFKLPNQIQDRWTVEHNFAIASDNRIPKTYPKYFDVHTKMSVFARRQEDQSRPSTTVHDMYKDNSFDVEIEDCEIPTEEE